LKREQIEPHMNNMLRDNVINLIPKC
jgi:hypothetical protein